jgi:urea transport system substrate-binding protein
MTTEAITPLRQRMIEDMKARKLCAGTPYVEANKGKVADWSWPWVCGGCTAPRYAVN